jgi:hypothetical protein
MANEKKFSTRHVQKHDDSEKWDLATDFIPLQGELIIYDNLGKFKIGDGVTPVTELDFATTSLSEYKEIERQLTQVQERVTSNELHISETQPAFACQWFHVTSIEE